MKSLYYYIQGFISSTQSYSIVVSVRLTTAASSEIRGCLRERQANLENKKRHRLEGLPKAIPSAKARKNDTEKSSSYVILS